MLKSIFRGNNDPRLHSPSGDHTQVGNITQSAGITVGTGATAVHVNALGDVGDVITGTKISLVNRAAAPRAKVICFDTLDGGRQTGISPIVELLEV